MKEKHKHNETTKHKTIENISKHNEQRKTQIQPAMRTPFIRTKTNTNRQNTQHQRRRQSTKTMNEHEGLSE